MSKLALYFGQVEGGDGHFLRSREGGSTLEPSEHGLPWAIRHLDTGLLKNGHVRDEVTGHVHWTTGGNLNTGAWWYAFYWWDRSGDSRPGSNSGFYVRGFGPHEAEAAFAYACGMWPSIVQRQKLPLVLVGRSS